MPNVDELTIMGLKVPKRHAGLFRRAFGGRSKKSAIRVYCAWCLGFSCPPAQCWQKDCAFYPYRLSTPPKLLWGELQEKKLSQMPERHQADYRRAMTVRGTARLGPRSVAIRSMCAECCGWERVRHWMKHCEQKMCPLHAYRLCRTSSEAGEVETLAPDAEDNQSRDISREIPSAQNAPSCPQASESATRLSVLHRRSEEQTPVGRKETANVPMCDP